MVDGVSWLGSLRSLVVAFGVHAPGFADQYPLERGRGLVGLLLRVGLEVRVERLIAIVEPYSARYLT